MKFIKNHLMFIMPLIAILFGIEFYLVFDRTTDSYEQGLKDGYSMLLVSKEPIELSSLQILNKHVKSSEEVERKNIVSKIAKGVSKSSSKEILASLPYFYTLSLDAYLNTSILEEIKNDLEADEKIQRVETFGSSYSSAYRLFSFIKFILKMFIGFMAIISLFLIIKQMEIWKYTHEERMQVMEIFGAPLILRSGVLFKVAFIDAFVATIVTTLTFLFVKYEWAVNSGIDILVQNQSALFELSDIVVLLASSLLIVSVAVFVVVLTMKGIEE